MPDTALQQAKSEYLLRLGDNALILGHRLAEWCGHAPALEIDMALTNIALDLTGQARLWLAYAGECEGRGRDEDKLAYLRDAWDFRNALLVEQPNGDFAHTIVRSFLFDVFNFYLHKELCQSKDPQIAAIAEKALKEIKYHLRYSSEWTIRLGDGTEESHHRMKEALEDLWMFAGELTTPDDIDRRMAEAGIAPELEAIRPRYWKKVEEVLEEATLPKPANDWMQSGGKRGLHSEHLGYILAEMQFLQRAYPGLEW